MATLVIIDPELGPVELPENPDTAPDSTPELDSVLEQVEPIPTPEE